VQNEPVGTASTSAAMEACSRTPGGQTPAERVGTVVQVVVVGFALIQALTLLGNEAAILYGMYGAP
jgi:hypothetical protein